MAELAFFHNDKRIRTVAIGERPLVVGRDAGVDVVPPEISVSRHHAKFWFEADRVFVRDLGSRNGTWVNRNRITGPQVVREGDTVRIGLAVTVKVGDGLASPAEEVYLQLVDHDSKDVLPLLPGVFRMGGGQDCDFYVSTTENPAVFLLSGDGTAEREVGEGWEPVRPGEPFVVGGRTFFLEPSTAHLVPTGQADPSRFSYEVAAGFHPSNDAWAQLYDPVSERKVRCEGGNKGVMLYLLAQPHLANPGRPQDDAWIVDEQLMSGIWGRLGDTNKLYVLIHRVRSELAASGFDASCVEKRPGITRLRLVGPSQPVRGR
jgi:hypothetical protein